MARVGYPSSASRSFRARCSRPCIDSWPMNPSTSSAAGVVDPVPDRLHRPDEVVLAVGEHRRQHREHVAHHDVAVAGEVLGHVLEPRVELHGPGRDCLVVELNGRHVARDAPWAVRQHVHVEVPRTRRVAASRTVRVCATPSTCRRSARSATCMRSWTSPSPRRSGWDGFFVWDHIQYEVPVPLADAWVSLERHRRSDVDDPTRSTGDATSARRPWKVAREAVTLDHLSGGRLVLGVGLGIDFWREFASFPGEAGDDAHRAALLDDGIEIIDRLWSGEPTTYRAVACRSSTRSSCPTAAATSDPDLVCGALASSRPGPVNARCRLRRGFPFSGAAMCPTDAAQVREAVASERRTDDPFDVCVWGSRTKPTTGAEDAGVTWFISPSGPRPASPAAHAAIAAGPP